MRYKTFVFLQGVKNQNGKKSNNLEYEDKCIEDSEEADTSTHFLRIRKNKLIDLNQHLEIFVNSLPVLGFKTGRYGLILIKSYLNPYSIAVKNKKLQ